WPAFISATTMCIAIVVFPEPPFSFPTTITCGEERHRCAGAVSTAAPQGRRLREKPVTEGPQVRAAVLCRQAPAQLRRRPFVPNRHGNGVPQPAIFSANPLKRNSDPPRSHTAAGRRSPKAAIPPTVRQ